MEILFIPGILCSARVWGSLNELRNVYACHDVDVSGHDNIEGMSESIIRQFKDSSSEKIVVGFSMGGYVALDLVLRNELNIKGLILLNTTAAAVNPLTIPDRKSAMELAKSGQFDKVLAYSYDLCFRAPNQDWRDLLNTMAEEIGQEAYLRQQNAIITRKSLLNEIENIAIKTLIVSARYDKIIPYQDAIIMFDKIKNSSLAIIDDCGHIPMAEQPAMVKQCVTAFLEDMM